MPKGRPEPTDPRPLADLMTDIDEMVQAAAKMHGVAFGSAVVALWEILCLREETIAMTSKAGFPTAINKEAIGTLTGNLMAYVLNHIPVQLRKEAVQLARQMQIKKNVADRRLATLYR